ncbi:uncharacterized protein [Macrobrachium rosenbergii]|uniref:uncharacterized protein n=1 Tax=Macrobrachium rosenbergii TaxID=79674 RepID=UPI0034D75A68
MGLLLHWLSNPFEGLEVASSPIREPICVQYDPANNLPTKLSLSSELPVLCAPVGARLLHFWSRWESRKVDPWVLQVLKKGYAITLSNLSHGTDSLLCRLREVFSTVSGSFDSVQEAGSGGSRRHEHRRILQSPLCSPQIIRGMETRPGCQCSDVQITKFKMKTNQLVLSAIHQGDWMVTIHMQDTYFHFPVHQYSRKYLRFMFQDRVFQFWALCFGFSTAPQVFTQVLATSAKWLHLIGINVSLYLDDWLLCSPSEAQCMEDLQKTLQLAQDLGLLINFKKLQLVPTQSILYLVIVIDSLNFWAFLSQQSILKSILFRPAANAWMSRKSQ